MDKITKPASSNTKKRAVITVIAAVFITVTLGSLYLHFVWNNHQQSAESEALQLAQSAAGLLPAGHIAKLLQNPKDRETPEYKFVKESLIKLVEKAKPVYYAYIVYEKNGEYFILADSNPSYFAAYPLPDQTGADGKSFDYAPFFQTGNTVFTQPVANHWGPWVRVPARIEEPAAEESIAVLVMSYSAYEWQARLWAGMTPDIIVTVFFMFLCSHFSASGKST
jgi:hypothetical protein